MSAQRAAGLTAAAFILGLAGVSLAAAPDAPISASVAALFVGQEKIVEGTVEAAQRDGSVVHLRLGKAPHALTVSLVIGLLSDFPSDPEHYYLGKTVRVAGTIGAFRDTPEIVVHDAADIRLVGAAAATGERLDAGKNATTDASLREQIQTLTERMRVLEERVQQLERSAPRGDAR
jgi:hypothetical protein